VNFVYSGENSVLFCLPALRTYLPATVQFYLLLISVKECWKTMGEDPEEQHATGIDNIFFCLLHARLYPFFSDLFSAVISKLRNFLI
jgi:hypothetical protein